MFEFCFVTSLFLAIAAGLKPPPTLAGMAGLSGTAHPADAPAIPIRQSGSMIVVKKERTLGPICGVATRPSLKNM